MSIPGGIGVPETKLMFGLVKTLIVEQEVKIESGAPTLPLIVAVQLFPDMAHAAPGRLITKHRILNISSTYRLDISLRGAFSQFDGLKP